MPILSYAYSFLCLLFLMPTISYAYSFLGLFFLMLILSYAYSFLSLLFLMPILIRYISEAGSPGDNEEFGLPGNC